jgi:hypothetical protein
METILGFLDSQPSKTIAVVAMVVALAVVTHAMRRHWRRRLLPNVVLEEGVPADR